MIARSCETEKSCLSQVQMSIPPSFRYVIACFYSQALFGSRTKEIALASSLHCLSAYLHNCFTNSQSKHSLASGKFNCWCEISRFLQWNFDDCMLPFAGQVYWNGRVLASRKWLPFRMEQYANDRRLLCYLVPSNFISIFCTIFCGFQQLFWVGVILQCYFSDGYDA